jgi:hypothetical protein
VAGARGHGSVPRDQPGLHPLTELSGNGYLPEFTLVECVSASCARRGAVCSEVRHRAGLRLLVPPQ